MSSGSTILNRISKQPTTRLGNILINSNFDIWQRGVTDAAVGATAKYLPDRWAFTAPDNTSTVTQESFTPGQTDVPHNPVYYAKIDPSAASILKIEQRIERATTLGGEKISGSFWVRSDGTPSFTIQIIRNTDGGTGDTDISIGSGTASTSWQKIEFTYTVPSASALATLGDDSYIALQVKSESTTSYLEFAQFQLNAGTVPMEHQQKPLWKELRDCKRYYHRVGALNVLGTGRMGLSCVSEFIYQYPVEMRADPTPTSSGLEIYYDNNWGGVAAAQSIYSVQFYGKRIYSTYIGLYVSTVGTVDTTMLVRTGAAGYLAFDAEL